MSYRARTQRQGYLCRQRPVAEVNRRVADASRAIVDEVDRRQALSIDAVGADGRRELYLATSAGWNRDGQGDVRAPRHVKCDGIGSGQVGVTDVRRAGREVWEGLWGCPVTEIHYRIADAAWAIVGDRECHDAMAVVTTFGNKLCLTERHVAANRAGRHRNESDEIVAAGKVQYDLIRPSRHIGMCNAASADREGERAGAAVTEVQSSAGNARTTAIDKIDRCQTYAIGAVGVH